MTHDTHDTSTEPETHRRPHGRSPVRVAFAESPSHPRRGSRTMRGTNPPRGPRPMKHTSLAIFLCAASAAWLCVAGQQPGAGRHEVRLNGHTFTLPEGFEIEQVAGPPLVNRPIVADFDEDGRLYRS